MSHPKRGYEATGALILAGLALAGLLVAVAAGGRAGAPVTVDGDLADWAGRPVLGATGRAEPRLLRLGWIADPAARVFYFVAETRDPEPDGLELSLAAPGGARLARVACAAPDQGVTVTLPGGNPVYHGPIGGAGGGRGCEWALPYSALGLGPGQALDLGARLVGAPAEALPETGALRWVPAATLGQAGPWLLGLLWLGTVAYLGRRGIWLLFFALGAAGFAVLGAWILRGSAAELAVQQAVAAQVSALAGWLGLPVRTFPGTILALVVGQIPGWTALQIDLECSGLLESLVFAGLALFFPRFTLRQRATVLVAGLAAIWAANLFRMVLVLAVLHLGGKDLIYLAHAVVGRLTFFALMVALYWAVFTRYTLRRLRADLAGGAAP